MTASRGTEIAQVRDTLCALRCAIECGESWSATLQTEYDKALTALAEHSRPVPSDGDYETVQGAEEAFSWISDIVADSLGFDPDADPEHDLRQIEQILTALVQKTEQRAPLKWTRTKPTEAGWYWLTGVTLERHPKLSPPYVVRLYRSRNQLFVEGYSDEPITETNSWDTESWSGPIPSPEEE